MFRALGSAPVKRLAIALAFAALAVPGSAAAATPVAKLDMAAELLRQPVGKPWSIALHAGAQIQSSDEFPPPPVRTITFMFPHATVHPEAFGTCSPERVRNALARGCPRSSLLGTGEGLVDVRPLLDTPVHADLRLFNGPKTAAGRQLFITAAGREIQAGILIDAVLKKTTGRYGYRLDVTIPPIKPLPTIPEVSVTGFDLRVQARGRRRVPFVEAPRVCPRGGLPFAATFRFADGSVVEDRAAIPCVLPAVPIQG